MHCTIESKWKRTNFDGSTQRDGWCMKKNRPRQQWKPFKEEKPGSNDHGFIAHSPGEK